VILVTAAIEHDGLDAGGDRPFGDQLADLGRGVLVGAALELGLEALVERRGGREGQALQVVDDLGEMCLPERNTLRRGRPLAALRNA
jgi:hypothetical protein